MVDVFTRKAYAEPMQTKDSDAVGATLQSMIMEHKLKPRVIISDSDPAYFGKTFQQVLDENGILLDTVTVGDHNAFGIVDNFAKRLKLIFAKQFIKTKNTKCVNTLQSVIKKYNNTPHSSIGKLTPNEAEKEENYPTILEINKVKQMYNKTISDLKPGDSVRMLTSNIFTKESEPKWSDEVYEVKKLEANRFYWTMTRLTKERCYYKYQAKQKLQTPM